jgi:hypothetical protein
MGLFAMKANRLGAAALLLRRALVKNLSQPIIRLS